LDGGGESVTHIDFPHHRAYNSTIMNSAFDDTAKTRYHSYFEQRGLRAISQYEVFSRSRATDLFVECSAEERKALQGTVFDHFRLINAIEFKGNNDPLTPSDFNVIMMRAWGIGVIDNKSKKKQEKQEQEEEKQTRFLHIKEIATLPTQRTVTIVCVNRPDNVLDTLHEEFKLQKSDEPGIYHDNAEKVPAWIIHPTELPLEPRYYPLLPLAYGEKLEQFIQLCIDEGLTEYLQLTLDIGLVNDSDVIWRKLMEAYGMQGQIREDTWPYIHEFFRNYPEEVRKLPLMKEVLKAKDEAEERSLRFEEQLQQNALRMQQAEARAQRESERARRETERVRAAEALAQQEAERVRAAEALAQQEAERVRVAEALAQQETERVRVAEARAQQEVERARAAETLAQQEAERSLDKKQQFLTRLLRHQFGELPENLHQMIDGTTDTAQLDQWLDQAFAAETLTDVNFDTASKEAETAEETMSENS